MEHFHFSVLIFITLPPLLLLLILEHKYTLHLDTQIRLVISVCFSQFPPSVTRPFIPIKI